MAKNILGQSRCTDVNHVTTNAMHAKGLTLTGLWLRFMVFKNWHSRTEKLYVFYMQIGTKNDSGSNDMYSFSIKTVRLL